MKTLLDTNVLLDLLLEREPWRAEAVAIAEASADGRIEAYVCASSITDIFYISRKLVGVERARQAGPEHHEEPLIRRRKVVCDSPLW